MQRALASAIGLPRRSTSAASMLAFLTPESVRRSFMAAPYQGQVDTESVIQHDRGSGEGRLARP
jgi:hypothetical protein